MSASQQPHAVEDSADVPPELRPIYCGFCGAHHTAVSVMIVGLVGYICDECVDRAGIVCVNHRRKWNDLGGGQ